LLIIEYNVHKLINAINAELIIKYNVHKLINAINAELIIKMKVVYLLSFFPKLSESFILNEIIRLVELNNDIRVFSLTKPNEKIIHDEFKHSDLITRTFYFNFYNYKNIFHFKTLNYFLTGCIQDLLEFKILSKKGLIINLKLAYFAKIIEDMHVDLIHTHFTGNFARKLSQMTGIQYSVTNHAFEIFINPNFEDLVLSLADSKLIFTPSNYNKSYLIKNTGCNENKIKIVHATINSKKFKRINPFFGEEIIMSGRLVEKKGMKYMILAMKNVINKYPNSILKIVGDGPLEKELKYLVKKNSLETNIKFLGSLSDEEYYNELESSIIAVLPCVIAEDGDRDVCPLTLQEAMSMELPVVSTNIHSIPELIDHGISGILVSPNNEKELANAIIKLLDNPLLRQEMGKKGREKILNEFNIESQVEKQIEYWSDIMVNT